MTEAAAFFASFIFVALKAFQQLNVVHDKFMLVLPTSLLMAACEVFVIVSIIHVGWGWIVLYIGTGAGLGAMFSMVVHKRLRHDS